MTWIGLQGDAEKLKDFQEKCLQYPRPSGKNRASDPNSVGRYDKKTERELDASRAEVIDYSRRITENRHH